MRAFPCQNALGADHVAGVEPDIVTQVPFVAPSVHVRHLDILISAADLEAATRPMFAKHLTAVRLRHIRS
jgi:hypothetical protein